MILLSIVATEEAIPTAPGHWDTFISTQCGSDGWDQYEHSLFGNFKAHWQNGVDMYTKFGQHELANNSCTVCASTGDFDFSKLLEKFNTLPNSAIIFDKLRYPEYTWEHVPQPWPIPTAFVTSYSSFMKLVTLWKWIDGYKNEPAVLERDTAHEILVRTMWQRNLQYTELESFT